MTDTCKAARIETTNYSVLVLFAFYQICAESLCIRPVAEQVVAWGFARVVYSKAGWRCLRSQDHSAVVLILVAVTLFSLSL